MSWSEEEFSAFQRERGQAAFAEAKAIVTKSAKRHKYRAEPCIVTNDLTLFTEIAIANAETLTRNPLAGTGSLKDRAARCGIYGDWIASTKEAKRWIELRRLQEVGDVRNLRRQVPYDLLVNGIIIGKWIADFAYELFDLHTQDWHQVREDSKGMRTPLYKRTKAHIEAQYSFLIKET